MSEFLFILGAGASQECGGPLMSNFFETARQLQQHSSPLREAFEQVRNAISELQVVQPKAALDLHNLESVFGAFEMARMIGRLPGHPERTDIDRAISALRKLIRMTLEDSIQLQTSGSLLKAPAPYDRFVDFITERRKRGDICAVVTFNYDTALDTALSHANLGPDYALDSKSSNRGQVKVFKLHGSINWAWCRKCRMVVPLSPVPTFRCSPPSAPPAIDLLRLPERLESTVHDCNERVEPEAVIVPPTWNKTEYTEQVEKVWTSAAESLSRAENIIVAGYSLPESDSFFRYLFALGSVGKSLIDRFWVFDPDNSGLLEERYRRILGNATLSRFVYYTQKFSKAIQTLVNEFHYIP